MEATLTGWNNLPPLVAGDLVFTRGETWLGRAIRWFSRRGWEGRTWANHVGMIYETDDDGPVLVEALWRVKIHPLRHYEAGGDAPGAKGDGVIVLRCPEPFTLREQAALRHEASYYYGRPYGAWKLLLHAAGLQRLLRLRRYPICSYLVAMVQDAVRPGLHGPDPHKAQPDDLLDACTVAGWPVVWASSRDALTEYRRCYGL